MLVTYIIFVDFELYDGVSFKIDVNIEISNHN